MSEAGQPASLFTTKTKSLKTMKKLISTLLVLAVVCLPAQLFAQSGLKSTATGGTDVGTTLCYAVISANGNNQSAPVLTYLNATSDKAASVVQFYTAGTPVRADVASSTTNLVVASGDTNGFAANDVVIIRHLATDTYERRILTPNTTATNLNLTVAPTTTVAVGDLIYKATAAGSIPVGNATKELVGPGIYAGQRGKPLLLEVDGTSACQINAVAASYPE